MEIGNTPVVVGRGEHVDIQLDDPSVSSTHAELVRRGGVIQVKDLNSTNGTFVNGGRIEGETALGEGDRIAFGESELELRGNALEEPLPEIERTRIVSRPTPKSPPSQKKRRAKEQPTVPTPTVPTPTVPTPTVPTPVVETRAATRSGTEGDALAKAAIALGVVAFLFLPIILGPIGIVLGAIAWGKGSRLGPTATTIAILGTVVGVIVGMMVWNAAVFG
jgi:pSer/pThr/pTyr-binding forkhead associated (FHA) protein